MLSGINYFRDGIIVAKSGNVVVYSLNDKLYLEIGPGHNLWALESEIDEYKKQLGNIPGGNCLEIGLGLGIASRCILSYPHVDSLTTIEKNVDVIQTHKQLCPTLSTKENKYGWVDYSKCVHRIYNCDGLEYLYVTKNKYNFVFLDCWDRIDEETLVQITDLVNAARKVLTDNGKVIGWYDPYTPEEFRPFFDKIFV